MNIFPLLSRLYIEYPHFQMRFTRILFNVGEKISKARGVLSVEVGASEKEIHRAYLNKAKLYHPDRNCLNIEVFLWLRVTVSKHFKYTTGEWKNTKC